MSSNYDLKQRIADAVNVLADGMEKYPECRTDIAEEYIRRNEIRPYPMTILTPSYYDTPKELKQLNEKDSKIFTIQERLLANLISASMPVQMLNPISPSIFLGRGPGTLAASFGMTLDPDAEYTPKGSRSIDEVLAEGMPDPENSGILPEIREQIETALLLTPDWIQIAPPDTQGPYNIAHMVIGEEALILPLLEPEKFYQFMTMITDFYIAFYKNLKKWIGDKRYTKYVNSRCRLRECSVNLISESMYIEHVLPHDIRIAEYFGELCVHPCSGRHVFYVTMRNLPNIVYHEAIPFKNSISTSIAVEEAIAEVGDRPIMLNMSRTIKKEDAKDIIRQDFEIIRQHPSFMFNYDIAEMTKANKEEMILLRRWMNAYWHEHIWGSVN